MPRRVRVSRSEVISPPTRTSLPSFSEAAAAVAKKKNVRLLACGEWAAEALHRALEAEVEVPCRFARRLGEHVVLADVHASGEGHGTVDQEALPVVAEIEVGMPEG